MIKALLLDFGGVIADEGYREGLFEIARRYNLNTHQFFRRCADLIYETGYITGKCDLGEYVRAINKHFNIDIDPLQFDHTILESFRVRDSILNIVDEVRKRGFLTGILSDQTDWLDKIDARYNVFRHFDFVFNSFHIGMGKRELKTFYFVAETMSIRPEEILFIDDQMPNIEMAKKAGIMAVCLTDEIEIYEFIKSRFINGG